MKKFFNSLIRELKIGGKQQCEEDFGNSVENDEGLNWKAESEQKGRAKQNIRGAAWIEEGGIEVAS